MLGKKVTAIFKRMRRQQTDAIRQAVDRKKCSLNSLRVIEDKLLEKWSPEQISGVLGSYDVLISHESIERHIGANKKGGGKLTGQARSITVEGLKRLEGALFRIE